MKKFTVFFLILVNRALDCYGCSCVEPPPPLETIKRADVVFVATVVSSTLEGDYERKFEFKIKGVLKGKLYTEPLTNHFSQQPS